MANEEQRAAWDGSGGERWAEDADLYDRMSAAFLDLIVQAFDPHPGESVLDVGCGAGALSLAVAALVGDTGRVTGVDISDPLLQVARQRAADAGPGTITFEYADAQDHDFGETAFDAITSRFGVMFFEDPAAAFQNLANALRPGGRLVFACWRELLENEWIMVPAVAALEHVPMPELGEEGGPGAYSLADGERVRSLLERAGLAEVRLQPVVAPVMLGVNVEDAIDFMTRGDLAQILLADADPNTAEAAWTSIRGALEQHAGEGPVELDGAAWLVSAQKPDAPKA